MIEPVSNAPIAGDGHAKTNRKRIVEKYKKRSSKNSQLTVVDGPHRVECLRRFRLELNETPEKWIEMPQAFREKLEIRKTREVATS